jgi:uncharacterized glyoxalase superfamily protein PhnB
MTMQIPEAYLPVMPYLVVKDAPKFLDFMKIVFGATEQYIGHRPTGEIMHAEIRIGPAVIMFTDANETYPPFPAGIFLYVEKVDEVFKKALTQGVTVLQEIANREYGRGGGFQDAFGNQWWVNTPVAG